MSSQSQLAQSDRLGNSRRPDVLPHVIDGRHLDPSASLSYSPVHNPATGVEVGLVALDDVVAVDAAVTAAISAYPAWSALPPARRLRFLTAFRDLVADQQTTIARMIGGEHGKVEADALGEVVRGIEVLDLARSAPILLKGEFSDEAATGVDVHSYRQPLGVCAGITPFNFPAMIPLWMFPIALVCGNTFVLKPSERDPSTAVFLADLALEAGLPAGVLNVVHGGKCVVEALIDHPGVAAVSFVGSTPVARFVYERATGVGKRVQAFGGAKNHMVVLADSDLDVAADAATSAAFGSTGQRCMAISVVVAVGGIADELVTNIARRIEKLTVGPSTDPASDMGPLTAREARNRVLSYLDPAVDDGAHIVVDGRSYPTQSAGNFVGPTLIDGVRPGMRVYDDEIFGPVLSVVRVSTLDEAIELVNMSPYGNGASIFTDSGAAARRFAREAHAGMVGVNVPIPVPVATHSFGGWKDSMFGDHHFYGEEGFRFYTRKKVVTSRWPAGRRDGVSLAFPSRSG